MAPRFAEAILDGRKTVELRRRPPRRAVSTALIYSTSPVKAVTGSARVCGVVEAPTRELWDRYGPYTDLNEIEYLAYFSGATRGGAVLLSEPERLDPIELSVIRARHRGWNPPQSFGYLAEDWLRELLAG